MSAFCLKAKSLNHLGTSGRTSLKRHLQRHNIRSTFAGSSSLRMHVCFHPHLQGSDQPVELKSCALMCAATTQFMVLAECSSMRQLMRCKRSRYIHATELGGMSWQCTDVVETVVTCRTNTQRPINIVLIFGMCICVLELPIC